MNGSGAGRSTRSTRALLNDYEPPNTKPASPAKKAREPRTASAARHKVTERLKSVNLPDTTVDVPHRPRKRAFPRALDDDRPAALPGSQRGKLRSVNVALTAAPPSPSQAKLSTKARAASGTQQLAAPGAMKWLKEPTTAQPRAIRAVSLGHNLISALVSYCI